MVRETIVTSAAFSAASSATRPSFGVATRYAIGDPTAHDEIMKELDNVAAGNGQAVATR